MKDKEIKIMLGEEYENFKFSRSEIKFIKKIYLKSDLKLWQILKKSIFVPRYSKSYKKIF